LFTGIVEETGTVQGVKMPSAHSSRRGSTQPIQLTVRLGRTGKTLKPGDSVAVNGCCLTTVTIKGAGSAKLARFDLLQETWQRTNLQYARPGALVNLERPLRTDGNLGGHFVIMCWTFPRLPRSCVTWCLKVQ
jgi:riboflavin synthase